MDEKAAASVKTSFRFSWDNDAIVFDILCGEADMKGISANKDVFSGDHVSVIIETQNHSYYHININPDGKIAEGNPAPKWKSLADVNVEKGPDFWRIKLRIPVVGDEEALADPNHRMAGSIPTPEDSWSFNIGRKRVRNGSTEFQAFSPTKMKLFDVPEKFAKLEVR